MVNDAPPKHPSLPRLGPFFRRLKAGGKPGFPRFRSPPRGIRSFDVPAPKICRKGAWNVVSVKGIGKFRLSGEADGTPRVLRIAFSRALIFSGECVHWPPDEQGIHIA